MTEDHYNFLKTQEHHFQSVKDGWLGNVDQIPMMEHIYRTYLDSTFMVSNWCKGCVFKMVERLSDLFYKV